MLLLHPNLFNASLFTPFHEVPISFKSFFMTSSNPKRGTPAFDLALENWLKRSFYGNLSSFFRRTCPSHLSLSVIIALESGILSHFSQKLLFEIRSVSRVPRRVRRQFIWNISSKSSSYFRNAHASETIFDHCHNCSFQYSGLGLQIYLPILPTLF